MLDAKTPWERFVAEPTFQNLDEDFRRYCAERKDVVWAGEGLREVVDRLIDILGPDYAFQYEEGFCQSSGCPQHILDEWLRVEWNQRHVRRVARLEEEPGQYPLLLIRPDQYGERIEIYTPKVVDEEEWEVLRRRRGHIPIQ